jgi:hypothetical protein
LTVEYRDVITISMRRPPTEPWTQPPAGGRKRQVPSAILQVSMLVVFGLILLGLIAQSWKEVRLFPSVATRNETMAPARPTVLVREFELYLKSNYRS